MVKTKTLDKDLKRFGRIEKAAAKAGQQNLKLGVSLLFLLLIGALLALHTVGVEGGALVVAAGVIGGYMALNIGANDVANNVGPAVGSEALTMFGALVIAAIFEASGAILAGGDVVKTISKGIIDPAGIANSATFTWAMMGALLAAAVWINLATFFGAPVSTTHSIVGGVMGAGIAAAGWAAVNWVTMTKIAASWVISPLLGGIVAAGFLAAIKYLIVFQDDKIAAAKRWVPVFVAIMAAAFAAYIVMKGLKRVWKPDVEIVLLIALGALVLAYVLVKPVVARAAENLENKRKSVGKLFTIPLICSAALLSFAHGANDVANAVGPLAAIVSTVYSGEIAAKVDIPYWVLVVGALGISAGLVLYGPKLVRTVGTKITKLDRMRAFTVALAASITVIVASALGLPVSSTHIAVGAIFGVGFFREWLVNWRKPKISVAVPMGDPERALESWEPGAELAEDEAEALGKKLEKKEKKARKRRLVRREHVTTIVAAWLVTVPLAAAISSIFYFTIRGMLLP